jgi:hypothetical protein
MIIDYNDFYRLRVDIFKSNDDLFRLVLERVDMNTDANAKAFLESKQEYFFNKQQLKDFVEYINEATHDNI